MFSHVQFCTLCLRVWRFHAKVVFICNILRGDLYFDASIFQICLVVSQTLVEGIFVHMFLLVRKGEELGELVQPGGKRELA